MHNMITQCSLASIILRECLSTAAGNVGIGQSSSLGINYSIQDDSATDTTQIKLRNYLIRANTKAGLMFECSTSGGQGGNSVIKGVCGTDAGGSNSSNDGGLEFQTSSGGSGTLATRMLIDSSGQVGIGRTPFTNVAGYALQIRGTSFQTFLHFSTATHGDTHDE